MCLFNKACDKERGKTNSSKESNVSSSTIKADIKPFSVILWQLSRYNFFNALKCMMKANVSLLTLSFSDNY